MSGSKAAPRAILPGELKALVRLLVKAAGGVEASAVELGISHQRISQLQDVNCPDQMTLMQVSHLERVAGRAIVTGACARAAEGESAEEAIMHAVVGSVSSVAELLALVQAMEADGGRTEAEKRAVRLAADRALAEVKEAADAAARL